MKKAPKSFLEFVCREELDASYGSSFHCPKCDPDADMEWASLGVTPPRGNHPIKFKCFNCGWWGDEFDIVKLVNKCDYPMARVVLMEMMERYQRELRAEQPDSTLGEHTPASGASAPQPQQAPLTPRVTAVRYTTKGVQVKRDGRWVYVSPKVEPSGEDRNGKVG